MNRPASEPVDVLSVTEPGESDLPSLHLENPPVRSDAEPPGPFHAAQGLDIQARSGLQTLLHFVECPRESFLHIPRKAGELALCRSTKQDADQGSQPQSLAHDLPI